MIADTYEELDSIVVIGLSQSYYTLDVGSYLNLTLDYGTLWPSDEVASGISWTCSDSSIVSCSSNGRSATLLGVSEGIVELTVKGSGIYNTLNVRIAVGDVPENTYYISCRKMAGIVVGENLEIEASLMNSNGEAMTSSMDEFTFSLDKEGVVSVVQADNVFSLTALSEGDVYLTVSHPLAKSSKCYVYTALTKEELDSYYPLSADKTSYLLSVGDTVQLSLNTIDDTKVSGIKWSCSNGYVCSYSVDDNKKGMKITAKKAGTCVFTARHADSKTDVAFTVYVTEYSSASSSIMMLTESIVGVVAGEDLSTVVQTNLEDSLCQSLVWSSSKTSVATVEGTGKNAVIHGVKAGICEVTVKYTSTVYRTMVVYVSDNSAGLKNYCCHNIDRRYSVVQVGGTLRLKPYFAYLVGSAQQVSVEDLYKNNVADFEIEDGSIIVTGKSEGIACFRVTNPTALNTYDIFVEVNSKAEVKAEDVNLGYLSIVKGVYVLSAKDTVNATEVMVSPVGIDSSLYSSIEWVCDDEDVAVVLGNGITGRLFANKVGETVVRVSSPYSSNMLSIRVVVTDEETALIPYISGDVSSFALKVGEVSSLEFAVSGGSSVYPLTGFSSSKSNDNVSLSMTGNVLKVRGLQSGQSIITVSYDNDMVEDVSFVVSVAGVADNLVYLTTDSNYAIITEKDYQTLSVSLVGYEEINENNFSWEVVEQKAEDGSSEVVSLSGNGASRLCKAESSGIARIKVVHENGEYSALYPVYITVKVTDWQETNPVYIKTESNVVTLTEGGKQTVAVELVNGNESSYSYFQWSTPTEDILRINEAGNQCVIQALSSGVGRVTVSHPDSLGGSIDFVVVVEAEDEGDPLYISTDSTLVEMSPNDSYKQVNVTLVGGTPEQNTLFSWEILSFESVLKNQDGTSNAVISMNGSQDSAIIKPLREGTSVIRVRNSATNHYLDIKVLVTLYSRLSFAKSYVSMAQYEVSTVDVETPTGKTVVYESSNENIAIVSGTSRKCVIEGVGIGSCVIMAHTSDGSFSDEIMVNVSKNTEIVSNYLQVSASTLTLNTIDDSKGVTVSAVLKGSGASESDYDSINWTMSEAGIVSFAGNTSTACVGREIVIRPVSQGEVSIVVSHEKAKNSRTLYVSVVQDAASLSVSSTYVTLSPGDIEGLTCTLSNVSEEELDSIVWASSDSSVVKFAGADVRSDGSVRGTSCQLMAVSEGSASVTCSYGNMTRTVSVFVSEKLSLTIPYGTVKVAANQTVRYKVECTPKSYYDRIHIEASSSIFATVKGEVSDGSYYIVVTGSDVEGQTQITARLEDLSSKMTVYTSNTVSVRICDYEVKDSSGNITKVTDPTNIRVPYTSQWVRLHYKTDPEGLTFDNAQKYYSMNDLDSPRFKSDSSSFLYLSYGKESSSYAGSSPNYVQITPNKCGYAVLHLYNTESVVECDVPVCFYDPTFSPGLISYFESSNTYGVKSSSDITNGIINIANGETVKLILNRSNIPVIMSAKFESVKVNEVYTTSYSDAAGFTPYALITGNMRGSTSYTKKYSTSYVGTFTVTVTYPDYSGSKSGEGKTYSKTFLVMQEEWR